MASIVTTDRRRRPRRPASAATAAATIAMFQPEIATTWLTPAVGECRRQVAVDPVAQADQDPGRQSGLGFGQDPGEGLARSPSQFLEAAPGIRRRRARRGASAEVSVPTAPIRAR